ncbi:MAG: hypothetical protein JWP52_205, partial [Rhizobacter sp.]|nr:hypothetical protein [Rhizobacter sp.]
VLDVLREPKRTLYDLAMTPASVEDRRALILPFVGTERRDVQDDADLRTPEQLRNLA